MTDKNFIRNLSIKADAFVKEQNKDEIKRINHFVKPIMKRFSKEFTGDLSFILNDVRFECKKEDEELMEKILSVLEKKGLEARLNVGWLVSDNFPRIYTEEEYSKLDYNVKQISCRILYGNIRLSDEFKKEQKENPDRLKEKRRIWRSEKQ